MLRIKDAGKILFIHAKINHPAASCEVLIGNVLMGFPTGLRASLYPYYCFSLQAAGNDTLKEIKEDKVGTGSRTRGRQYQSPVILAAWKMRP